MTKSEKKEQPKLQQEDNDVSKKNEQKEKKTDPANGINEYKDSHELMAHVIILRKLF